MKEETAHERNGMDSVLCIPDWTYVLYCYQASEKREEENAGAFSQRGYRRQRFNIQRNVWCCH